MDFWDVIWFVVVAYALVAYLMVMYWLVSDVLRDPGSGGFQKVVWIVALLVLPFVTAVVYVVARGREMAERFAVRAFSAQLRDEARRGAGTPPVTT
jgi:Phospholipase_D-nuclease N-terminal